jgi:hypothetical protein
MPCTGISLRSPGTPRDISRWYLASFAGTCSCITLYTLFGIFFVRLHARMISEEMALVAASGMTALISPGDCHLLMPVHQVSSALFFGLTLGVLCSLICMVVTLPAWISGRFIGFDLAAALCGCLSCIYLTFSRELPLVSIMTGIFCPVFFVLPWSCILRTGRGTKVRLGKWAFFAAVLVSPLVLIMVPGSSFLNMRDAMITLPLLRGASDFYYDHTLLAADVIKHVKARSQNVIAMSRDIDRVGRIPHGTLWVRSQDPCGVKGARIVISRRELQCDSILLPDDGRPANDENRVFDALGGRDDPNRLMRMGLGIFFYSGPMLFMTALLLSWLALGLERSFARNKAVVAVILLGYLMFFAPAYHGLYLLYRLEHAPQRLTEYAVSSVEKQRYLAVTTYPGALSTEILGDMLKDPSARIRINALIEAGQRRDKTLLPMIARLATDPQMNVRTKACWALGRMGSRQSLQVLDKVARDDPAWYVRDYAYAAVGRIRPEAKVVNLVK